MHAAECVKKLKDGKKWELSVRANIITSINLFNPLNTSLTHWKQIELELMKHFDKAWIANDDKEVEGKWEDWYTDKVDDTKICMGNIF